MAVDDSYNCPTERVELDFQSLVDQFYAPLYRFAVSLTHSESDAGDLVQETFLTWATKGHQLLDSAKVKSWLFTTLHRKYLETQRRIVRFPHQEISETENELPTVEPATLEHLDAQDVVDLLAQVDDQYRSAVALFYLEDYAYADISGILDIPVGTVKSRISRGIGQLRQLIRRSAGFPERQPPEARE